MKKVIPTFFSAFLLFIAVQSMGQQCPTVFNPVCADDGNTYLNACYAEAAGVNFYTTGTCHADCIDPGKMDPDKQCNDVYEPVVGCNGILYKNECEAVKYGVVMLQSTAGMNAVSAPEGCFDYQKYAQTIVSQGVTQNGIINSTCPDEKVPVCGCNGITYKNACTAEASGIINYTYGACEDRCLGAPMAAEAAQQNCPDDYDPVCGCNEMTYKNPCLAEAAGVEEFRFGTCLAANWQNKAISITCGSSITEASSPADGNDIWSYPGCNTYTFNAPEKVFVIQKNVIGDLQVGMEILSQGVDLDLFVLDGMGNQVNCLGQSIRPPGQTKEAVVLNNAPIGTYYIVVDGQNPDDYGQFILEVACGYLDCSNATYLMCGDTISGNNASGSNNILAYYCGPQNLLNIDNSGPEVIYTFTTPVSGQVTLQLSGLQDNLELFLLDACDRSACLYSSQNSGTLPEVISQHLDAGTYYVVVDGYHGAVSDFDLSIRCPSACTLGAYAQNSGSCQPNGSSITVQVQGGTPSYLILLDGPVQMTGATQNTSYTFSGLPTGLYTVEVIDANGCYKTFQVNLSSGSSNFNVYSQVQHPACGQQNGSISLQMSGGQTPYTISLNGTVVSTTTNTLYTISNLAAGNYTIEVTDANGCAEILTETLNTTGGFTFAANVQSGSCSNSSVALDIVGGTAPFDIFLNGNFLVNTTNRWYIIQNLVQGYYTIRIVDANGCEKTRQIFVHGGTGNLHLSATVQNAACGQSTGSITIDITGGNNPFQLFLNGNLVTTISNRWYTFQNLTPGNYTVRVVDANGCEQTIQRTIQSVGGMAIQVIANHGSCNGQNGSLQIQINSGMAPFDIFLNGNYQVTTAATNYTISNLPAGNYTVRVVDDNGCEDSEVQSINSTGNLYLTGTVTHANCGQQNGQVALDVQGGTAPFDIYLNGTLLTTTSNRWYILQNLAPGTYTIKVVDANGCEDTIIKTINGTGNLHLNGTVTNASCAQHNGSIALNIQGGSGPFDILLNGTLLTTTNNRTYVVGNLGAGTYQVKVIDQNGCYDEISRTVQTQGGIVLAASVSHADCGINNGYIMLDVQGGTDPFDVFVNGNFLITTSNRWYIIDSLAPGTYTIRVVDANGCEDTITKVVNGSGGIHVTATTTACGCGAPNGSITLDITGGMGPFDVFVDGVFLVSTNNRWYTIQNLNSGTYNVRVVDKNGCEDTIVKTVGGGGNIYLSGTVTHAGCGSQNGSITLDIQGGVAPFDVFVNGSFLIATNNRWYTINNLGAGTYTVRVVDANGCEGEIVKTIQSTGSNFNFTYLTTGAGCGMQNGTITVTINGGAIPYQIFADGNLVTTITSNIFTIQDLSPGNHVIKIKDGQGCEVIKTINVPQGGGLYVAATVMNAGCGQGSIMLDISGGAAPFDIYINGTYYTTTSDRWYTIYNLAPGTYTLRVVDVNGCEGTITKTVTGSGNNLLVHSGSTPCGCGLGTGTITIDIENGSAPYDVYLNDTLIATIPGDTYTFGNLFPGTYDIKVVDANGCEVEIQETVDPGPGVDLQATVQSSNCTSNGGVVNLDIAGGVAPFEIYQDGVLIATTSDRWYDVVGLSPGTYIFKVIDAHGCEDSETVTVHGSSPIQLTSSSTACSCVGNTGTITVNITGGTAPFKVFLDGILIATTPNRQYTIAGLGVGTYDVRVVDKFDCEATITETVHAASNLNILTQSTACGCGQSNGTIIVDIAGGPAPYQIYLDGQLIATTPNAQYIIGGLNPGTYDIRVVDANGCEDTATENVQGQGSITVLGSSTPANCGMADGTININNSGGMAPYEIFLDGNFIASTQDTFFLITDLHPGTYEVVVVDKNGCEGSKRITVDESNNIQVLTTNSPCGCAHANGSITLDIQGGVAPYDIEMNDTLIGITFNQTFTVAGLATGVYDFNITDANGCVGMVSDTVGTGPTVYFSAHAIDANCGQPGSIEITIQDGVGPYMIFLDGNMVATTADTFYVIDNLMPDQYLVRVKDSLGCTFSKLIQVGGSTILDLTVTAVNDTCGNGGSAILHIHNGTPPYDIQLDGQTIASTSDTIYEIFNLSAGNYAVRVEGAGGCFDLEGIQIDSFGIIPHAFFTYMIRPGGVVKFFADSIVGTPFWDFGDGDTSTLQNPVHTFPIDSTFVVCLTTTTFCGTDTYCDTLTIPTVYSSNLVFKMENIEGRKGQTLSVPVMVENFDRVTELQYSIQVADPAVLEITGIGGVQLQGLNAALVNPTTVTLTWDDDSGNGLSLPNDFPIVELDILLKGDRGDCSEILFGNQPLSVEVAQKWFADPTRVMPVFIDADAVCINMMVSVSGNLHREDHQGIPGATVVCNNTHTRISESGSGDFIFDDLMYGSNCMLLPTKDGEDRNGLNILDVVRINKQLNQRRFLNSPYSMIAGDMNRDGRISYNDKKEMLSLLKGDQTTIISGDSWRFIPTAWQFSNPQNPFDPAFPVMVMNVNVQNDLHAVDFVGVKLGDVDNSYSFDGNHDVLTAMSMEFFIEDQVYNAGDRVRIPVRASNFRNVSGFQLALTIDHSKLTFTGLEAATIPGMGNHNAGIAHLTDDKLTLVWHDEEDLPFGISRQADDVLFYIVFEAVASGRLHTQFAADMEMLQALGVNAEGAAMAINFEVNTTTSVSETGIEKAAIKAYPNPFHTRTWLELRMPVAEEATVSIFDQTGKVIHVEKARFQRGLNLLELGENKFSGAGVYFYRVSTKEGNLGGKLVFMP